VPVSAGSLFADFMVVKMGTGTFNNLHNHDAKLKIFFPEIRPSGAGKSSGFWL
jgi:hypothetical protein